MAEIRFEAKGFKELREALRRYPKTAEPIAQKTLEAMQFIFQKHTLKNDPVPYRTGNLLMSFRFARGRLWARWFPTAHYAPFVEFGRGWVFPQRARALSWEAGGGGRYVTSRTGKQYYKSGKTTRVFAMYARPAKAKPFMQRILQKAQPDIEKLMKDAQDIINREITKQTNAR